ncbi:MAG: ribulose-phosphate 3-epimerase [Candidatus Doudnabacteria bacterium]|nr:ribulose-phosphate 3-epimerase [Candidatus Doudnabacteria bacterium]
MAVIIPAILEDTVEAFRKRMATVLKLPDLRKVQVDISDGEFTDRKTVQLVDIDVLNPMIEWEVHLMVLEPQEYFFEAKLAGFNTIVIHYEAIEDKNKLKILAQEIRELKIKPALAIKAETSVEQIQQDIQFFDQILLLTVNPGFQGQQMESDILEKLRKLKNASKNVIIEVDGGVKLNNVKELSEAGAEMFVIGSALFDPGKKSTTPAQNFEEFSRILA